MRANNTDNLMRIHPFLSIVLACLVIQNAFAQIPPPPSNLADWPMNWDPGDPGDVSADFLLDKPAAKNGPIVIRDGHFFSGSNRVRFWGISIAFGGNFPTHDQADIVAARMSRFGINAVRLHHMDNRPYPGGIFADDKLQTLSTEAMDRLDYFVAALKKNGVYVDINLHVSREYDRFDPATAGKPALHLQKMVDLFDPDLIALQKQYARDLLGHVNTYTHARYADEPAVAFLEFNNENSLFMWNAQHSLETLASPYREELNRLWNDWLAKKYGSRDKLKAVWAVGESPLGENLLVDPVADGQIDPKWNVEQHDSAHMDASVVNGSDGQPAVQLSITAVDDTNWHLQFDQPGLKVEKGKFYTVSFTAAADHPGAIAIAVSQAHAPWNGLGLQGEVSLDQTPKDFTLGFTANESDDNARLMFVVGQKINTITLSHVQLREGGRLGLREGEELSSEKSPVQSPATGRPETAARSADWYQFLHDTEEKYYVQMHDFLKNDLAVKCPITGTIGFGPLGTAVQAKMDFVDAHAYWDHPTFPHRQWDQADWRIENRSMVDQPDRATLFGLAATRVAGKPFTVTEYNHAAPNEWQAECIPLIASYAALQNWDAVFLFAYSHDANYESDKMNGYFNFEGNPLKMPLMPMGARISLGTSQLAPANEEVLSIPADRLIPGTQRYSLDMTGFLRDVAGIDRNEFLANQIAISFENRAPQKIALDSRAKWTAQGPGTGRYLFRDPSAAVFVGFSAGAMPIDMGPVKVESLDTLFATIMVVSADPSKTIDQSDRLLITAIARAQNTGMQWDAQRLSVGTHWGTAPTQIEVVHGTISVDGNWKHAFALDPHGQPAANDSAKPDENKTTIRLGDSAAVAYELTR
jgi:Carbohydrate binding domain